MEHSIIVRFFKKIIDLTKKYYSYSAARKFLNNISSVIRNVFINSYIYKLFTSESKNGQKLRSLSVIGKIENLIQKVLGFFHSLYCKGTKGSFAFKLLDRISRSSNRNKIEFISLAAIGIVLTYNILGFINKSIYINQLYISVIIIILAINMYFIDIVKLYRHSFMKKIVDSFIKI